MTEQSNVITIDGKEYNAEDLSQDQNYFINQIKDLQAKGASLRFQLDQVTVAQNAFTNSLMQSVKGEEEPKEEKGLLIMDQHVDDIRYLKGKVISVGNFTEGVKENDTVYYDRRAGHGIEYDDNLYQVIKQQDVVLVG